MTEDVMVGRHHQLDGHEFEQALDVGDIQESLVCCHLWRTELDTTEQLNSPEPNWFWGLVPDWLTVGPDPVCCV